MLEGLPGVPRPLVFLDIDGVVVTEASLRIGGAKCADSSCVSYLNAIIAAADAEVVISSSWRTVHTLDFIRDTLCAAGFRWPERVVGATEHLHYRSENGRRVGRAERSDEIRAWLRNDPRERFVIIDDESEAYVTGHFVQTHADHGLSEEHVASALAILKVSNRKTDI